MVQYIYDYNLIDVTKVEQMHELDYLSYVEETLIVGTQTLYKLEEDKKINQDEFDAEIEYMDKFIKNKLLAKGISVDIKRTDDINKVDYRLTIKSRNMDAYKTFSVPIN